MKLTPVSTSCVFGALLGVFAASGSVWAQEPKSATGARELAQLLGSMKLEAVAVRLPNSTDEFASAMIFPGQLMVVWAKTVAPERMNERIVKKEYKDVYADLNSASIPATKHFVMDLGGDGLRSKPASRGGAADTHDLDKRSIRFDGSWKEDKMSEADYVKAHAEADAAYAAVTEALVAALKKG
jgi:hypothetical protein